VSLLERLGRGHLDDREFARLWTTGGGHPHLDACATCQARFEEFDRWVLGLGGELRVEAEADNGFVLLRWHEFVIGVGLYRKPVLKSQIPRFRSVEEPGSD